MATRQRGIDLSHWQGEQGLPIAHWTRLQACGVRFAIIKATQGTGYVDPALGANLKRARSNGILTGVYHFMERGLALAQADHFLRTTRAANGGDLAGLLLVGDVERVPTATTADDPDWRTVRGFFNRLAAKAPKPFRYVYSSAGYWGAIGNPDGQGLGSIDGLWQARWDGERHTCKTPNLPPSPPRAGFGGWGQTAMWQYGMLRYSVPNGMKRIDGNAFYGSIAELRDLFDGRVSRSPLQARPQYRRGYNAAITALQDQVPAVAVAGDPGGPAWPAGVAEARLDVLEALEGLRLSTP